MQEESAEDKIRMLVKFVDDNYERRKTRQLFRVILPVVFILVMLIFIFFLALYQWTEAPILNWTPGLVSIVAIVIAFISYLEFSLQSANKRIAYSLALRLGPLLPDKSEETFHLLVPLVALKENHYPLKLSVLYKIDKRIFSLDKLAEYYYLNV